ncbi:glycosyl hydrolase [Micromonospora sp. NPDC049523]|uniref:glycoside hydrolase family 26 protein n=1 Tax=Micromonospora sp. NPDC049523 TaxID=3155921 RepID=UPI00343C6CB2
MTAGRRSAVLLLVALAAAVSLAGCGSGDRSPAEVAEAEVPSRVLGVAMDPWHVDEWAGAVGAPPTMVMEFEAWSRNRTIDTHFAELRRQGVRTFMLTWEPWQSVSADKGRVAQYVEQPEFSNAAIAAGKKDEYIRSWAKSVAASGLLVYVRYAHEMNGNWYPWSRDPAGYVAAWRHIVDIFRAEGATNARFVFSVNPSIFEPAEDWTKNLRGYWPGDDYVDLLGSTMINFGARKEYSVADFVARFELARGLFNKKFILTEVNTAAAGRVKWLSDLRTWLDTGGADWVEGLALSQAESRGAAQLGDRVGDLSWNVVDDPETQPVIRGILQDFEKAPPRP